MAQIQIFSKTWFDMLEQANDKIGDLYLSPAMKNIRLNMLIMPNIPTTVNEEDEIHNQISEHTNKRTKQKIERAEKEEIEVQKELFQLEETIELRLLEGCLYKGADENAKSTINLSYATMRQLLTALDMNAVMQAFINGEITVMGDVSQLMALQMTKASEEQKALFMTILENTKL